MVQAWQTEAWKAFPWMQISELSFISEQITAWIKILNFENAVIYIASKVTEICNNSALVQVMTQHWKTDKQLSEPMVIWPINVSSGLHVLIEYYFF